MDKREVITQEEYNEYLINSSVIHPVKFTLLFTPLILILTLPDIIFFNKEELIMDLIVSIMAMLILYLYININQKNNIYRNRNSEIREKNNEIDLNMDINGFENKYLFSFPVTHRYISDELPGILYVSEEKVTFIANRIIGLKLVWFNLNKLVKGYYDLNFLPCNFESTFKIKDQAFFPRFILRYPSKILVITEKRLYSKKRYVFKIPISEKILEELNRFNFNINL